MIELIHGDCQEYMAGLEDDAFDLAIVDPPFGIGVNSMNMGSRKTIRPDCRKWDDKPPPEQYFVDLKRVSKNQIIWGGNYFKYIWPSRCFLVWDKGESMYGRSFAECEMAYTSFDKSARMTKINPMQLDRIHTTQKPVQLYKWLLNNYAKPGDRILDTHLGSASSAIACHDHGFDMVGIELDEDYYLAAKNRYEKHIRQQRLF